jgi:hypothetical protein
VLARLPRAVPVPEELRRDGFSQAHITTAIGGMGLLVAAAAADGVRSGGRSAFFRGSLLAFGVHGFGHVGASVAGRRYTSGVLTAPTVVIPYWVWARRRLGTEGVAELDRRAAVTAAAVLPLLPGLHVLTYLLLRRRSRAVGAGSGGPTTARPRPGTATSGG